MAPRESGRSRTAAKQERPKEPVDRPGPVEEAVLEDLDDWAASGSLAQLAIALAVSLDAGAGLSTAAVARELRATLAELAPRVDDDADRDAELVALLSSPMVDPSN